MQIPYNFEPYFTLPIILNCFLDFNTTGSEMGGESLQRKWFNYHKNTVWGFSVQIHLNLFVW